MRLTILERPTPLTQMKFPTHLTTELVRLKGELDATLKFEGFSPAGWACIEVSGPDAEIVSELISKRFGRVYAAEDEIKASGVHPAEILEIRDDAVELEIPTQLKNIACVIPSERLSSQLADGRRNQPRRIADYYCLHPSARVSVRVDSRRSGEFEAWLSDAYVNQLANRVTTGLDRIQVLDCYKNEAESAILKAHLARDIIRVEETALTLQSMVCKLGTDAIGLIPKLGHAMREKKLKPFLPKRILERCRPW